MQPEPGVHGVADQSIWPSAHQLMTLVHLEHEVVMASERGDRPQGEDDAESREHDPEPLERLRHDDLGTRSQSNDDIRDGEEIRDERSKAARSLDRRTAPPQRAALRQLCGHDEEDAAAERDRGYEIARRKRSADRAFDPSSSWRKYAYTSLPESRIPRIRAAQASTASSL